MNVKLTKFVVALAAGALFAGVALAGDDPTIPKDTRAKAQAAMDAHIKKVIKTNNGKFKIEDKVTKEVLLLDFDNLHSGLVRKSGGYVACADFNSTKKKYDIDFLVKIGADGKAQVVKQAIHAVDGTKRKGYLD